MKKCNNYHTRQQETYRKFLKKKNTREKTQKHSGQWNRHAHKKKEASMTCLPALEENTFDFSLRN